MYKVIERVYKHSLTFRVRCKFPAFKFVLSVLAKRLAGKSVSEGRLTYVVSSTQCQKGPDPREVTVLPTAPVLAMVSAITREETASSAQQ